MNGHTYGAGKDRVSFKREEYCIGKGEKRIYGELYRPEGLDDPPVLIMSHGFNGSSRIMRYEAECMAGRGVAVYAYDFCGGGLESKSSGTTLEMTIPSEQEDLKVAVSAIKELSWVNEDRVYLFGASQGGFVTALTVPELNGIAGVFMEFPALCIPDDWKDRINGSEEVIECMGVSLGKCFVDTLPDYDVYEKAAEYTGRVVIFHGTDDRLVPILYSRKLCEAYKNAELYEFPGQGHGFTKPFVNDMTDICRKNMTG